MRPSFFVRYLLKASFSKYGYTSEKERIRPFILRLGLCFSLMMGVLLMEAGWKMTDCFFSSKEIRLVERQVENLIDQTSLLSPALTIRKFFHPEESIPEHSPFETIELAEESEFTICSFDHEVEFDLPPQPPSTVQ